MKRVQKTLYITKIFKKFQMQLEQLRNSTSKLWIYYYRAITMTKKFMIAEQSGDWALRLQSVYEMLPFFHSKMEHFSEL